jgi:hypothetical protein
MDTLRRMGSTKVHLNPKESHYFDRKGDSYSFLNIEPTQPGVTGEERSAPILPASLQTDGPQLRGFSTTKCERGFDQAKQATTRSSSRPKRRSQCREN